MTINRNCLTKADAVVIAAIEAGVPSLIEARALVDQFHDMIRKKDEAKLDLWIANAKRSLVSSFATGVLKDRAAVRAAIIQPWSNGQVEAQITKLKLVNDKCTAARKSTFWKHDCWGLRDPRRRHLICVRPNFGRRSPGSGGQYCRPNDMLSIYYPVSRSDVMKVFSAHVISVPQFGDIAFYQYWDNHVGILSWRRGGWEELIMLQETASLTVSEAFARRIFAPCPVH